MNDFFPSLPLAGSDTAFSGFGAANGVAHTSAPFGSGVCPCQAAVRRSRDLIQIQCASTLASCDRAMAAIRRSHGIEWTGNAAGLFRLRLHRTMLLASSLADDIADTRTLIWGSP